MALTGFNPEQVKTSVDKVIAAYNELINQIGDRVQKGFVNGMADKWACKEAQIFFNTLKNTVDNLNKEANQTFQSVVDAMNSAAATWANSTGSVYNPVQGSLRQISINVDNILENINGVRGIDLQLSSSVSKMLPSIQTEARLALEHAKHAVSDCGFVGGNQAENLISSLDTIKNIIDNEFTTITDEAKKAIDDTIAVYSNVEGKVSQAFLGQ